MLHRLARLIDRRPWRVLAACVVAFLGLTYVSVTCYSGRLDPAWMFVARLFVGFLGGYSLARTEK